MLRAPRRQPHATAAKRRRTHDDSLPRPAAPQPRHTPNTRCKARAEQDWERPYFYPGERPYFYPISIPGSVNSVESFSISSRVIVSCEASMHSRYPAAACS